MTNEKLFTVGMATFDDADRTWATVQMLRILHGHRIREIIIVDNSPADSSEAKQLGNSCKLHNDKNNCPIVYERMSSPVGTAQPRNAVFDLSTSPVTVCIDPHIFIYPGSFDKLHEFYSSNPGWNGLMGGVLVDESLRVNYAAFFPTWGSYMFGAWDHVYEGPDGKEYMIRHGLKGPKLYQINPFEHIADPASIAKTDSPDWWKSFVSLDDKPGKIFNVPAQGLGLFVAETKSWLRFNWKFRQFGGEEYYIHEKYRQAGREVKVMSDLRWVHHFRDMNIDGHKIRYPNQIEARLKNYIIGWREIGKSLDGIYHHFVVEKKIPENIWQKLIEDDNSYDEKLAKVEQNSSNPTAVKTSENPATALPETSKVLLTPGSLTELKRVAASEKVPSLSEFFDLAISQQGEINWAVPLSSLVDELDLAEKSAVIVGSSATCGPALLNKKVAVKQIAENISGPLNLLQIVADRENAAYSLVNSPNLPETLEAMRNTSERYDFAIFADTANAGNLKQKLADLTQMTDTVVILNWLAFAEMGQGSTQEQVLPGMFEGIKDFLTENNDWRVVHSLLNFRGEIVISRTLQPTSDEEMFAYPPGRGVGTELKKIIYDKLGIKNQPGCGCNRLMRELDILGVPECERRYDKIVEQLRQRAENWGWTGIGSLFKANQDIKIESDVDDAEFDGVPSEVSVEKLTRREKWTIAARAAVTGVAFHINPDDPMPGVLSLAIKNAKKQK